MHITLSTDSIWSFTPIINIEEEIIGIDLGITYSCVSIFKNNMSSILENKNGKRTKASIIKCKENEILIEQKKNKNKTLKIFKIIFNKNKINLILFNPLF